MSVFAVFCRALFWSAGTTTLVFVVSSPAWALPDTMPSGANLTLGPSSDARNVHITRNNPAAPAQLIHRQKRQGLVRFGVLSSTGLMQERAGVADVEPDLASLRGLLEQTQVTSSQADDIKSEYDLKLQTMAAQPYLKAYSGGMHSPFMPFTFGYGFLGGVVSIDVKSSVQNQVALLYSPVQYNVPAARAESASALYIKNATILDLSLGFSRKLTDLSPDDSGNALHGGLRLNYIQAGLRKSFTPVLRYRPFNDLLVEEVTQPAHQQSNLTFDLGVVANRGPWTAGISVEDLGLTSYSYKPYEADCAVPDSGYTTTSCQLAHYYADTIALREEYTLYPKVTVDASVAFPAQDIVVAGYFQAIERRDFLGNPQQYLGVSMSYLNNSLTFPGIRLGYHQNLVGTKLGHLALGMSYANLFQVDVAFGLEKQKSAGSTTPRKIGINLGFSMEFDQ